MSYTLDTAEKEPGTQKNDEITETSAAVRAKTLIFFREAGRLAEIPYKTADTKEKAEVLTEDIPDDIPGRKAAALAGITEDLEVRELRGTVMNISLKTRYPKAAYADIKEAVNLFNGTIIAPDWSEVGEIGVKAVFTNLDHAEKAANIIKRKRPKAKFTASDEKVHAFTFDGDIFTTGRGDILNIAANTNTEDGQMTTYRHNERHTFNPSTLDISAGEIQELPAEKTTSDSIKHARERIQPPNIEIPDTGVLLQIHIPKNITPKETARLVNICIDGLQTPGMTIKSMQGNIATLYIAGERSPGNILKKLATIQKTAQKAAEEAKEKTADEPEKNDVFRYFDQLTFVLDYGNYRITQLDDTTYTLQGKQNKRYHYTTPNPGTWITRKFRKASENERNLAVATCRHLGTNETVGLEPIDNIESVEFHPVIFGRETVGRDTEMKQARALIAETSSSRTTNFLTITGSAGIGKTNLLKRILDHAKDEEHLKTTYYKIMEDGPSQHAQAVRKLIQGILEKTNPEIQSEFLDLKYFAEGEVPKALETGLIKTIQTLNNNSEYLGERLAQLMTKAADVVTVDDCQWLDEFSLKALNSAVKVLPQKSGTLVIFVGRNEEEPLPESLQKRIEERGERQHKIEIGPLKTQDIESCIRAHLPPNLTIIRTIPENFVRKIETISGGIPLIITEILSILLMQKEISAEGDMLVTPSDERLEAFAKDSPSETLSTVIQAKFSRLTNEELDIIDYLVVIGETEIELFETILQSRGISKARIRKITSSLEHKKIVRKIPKFGFLYDQMASERKRQITDRAYLSKTAATCYTTLKDNRAKHPQYVTPPLLFRMLALCIEHPEQLDEIERTAVSREYLPLGNEAIDYCMDRSQNLQAIDIVGNMAPVIEKLTSGLATKPDDEIARIGRYLYGTHLRLCRANLRVGRVKEARDALGKIAALATTIPQAEILVDVKGSTTVEATNYHVLRTAIAFAQRSPADMQAANLSLSQKVTEMGIKLQENDPILVLTKGELLLAKVQEALLGENLKSFQDIQSNQETAITQQKLTNLMQNGESEVIRNKAHALLLDIIRQIAQAKSRLVTFKDIEGKTGEESLFLQEVSMQHTQALLALQETINGLIEIYESKPNLLRDHESYGYLLDTAARIEYLLTNSTNPAKHRETAEELVKKALRTGQNLRIPQFATRIRLLKGNFLTQQNLRKHGLNVEQWESKNLREAVDNHDQGYSEMLRIKAEDEINALVNSQNGALAFGMYVLAVTSKTSKTEPDKEEIGRELQSVFYRTCKTLKIVKSLYYNLQRNGEYLPETYRDVYRNELSTIGFLLLAASKLGKKLDLPDYIEPEIIKESKASLQKLEQTPDLTEGDKIFLELRKMGMHGFDVAQVKAEAAKPKELPSEEAIAYADTITIPAGKIPTEY